LGEFVLGDSGEPKDTLKTLARLNYAQKEGLRQLMKAADIRECRELTPDHARDFLKAVDRDWREYALAAVENHWITREAKQALLSSHPDTDFLAGLMNQLQRLLRDKLRVSTPRLNAMIDAGLEAGALAAKINGSGEGGCMFAWCPGKREAVMEAIRRAGGRAMAIDIGPGLRVSTKRSKKSGETR